MQQSCCPRQEHMRKVLVALGVIVISTLPISTCRSTSRPESGEVKNEAPVQQENRGAVSQAREEALGIQGFTADDQRVVAGSRFSVVRDAVFANPYQKVWGAKGNAPLVPFPVTFMPLIKGMLPGGGTWQFLAAAKRVLASDSDLRWGPDGKGFRRLLHTNGICMTGLWAVTEDTPYTGYFRKGSRGLIIARYSTCCTETRRGNTR